MSPETLYLENLRAIERIAAYVARRNHLGADETEEFTQEVRVRLLENDYGIIRKFEGRSLFTTFLTTVISNLFHQYRVEMWGKWRPSAEAKRLGDKAITLERLITRDGFTLDEAVKVLTIPTGSQYTIAELEAIYLRLPPRNPRPVVVSGDIAPDAASIDADAYDNVEQAESEGSARRAATTIDGVLQSMEPQDRLLLEMRFWHSLKVPDIAQRLHVDQKKLYKRLDRLFGTMRSALEKAGLGKAELGKLLSRGDQEIHFDVLQTAGELRHLRPSQDRNGDEVRGGEGGLR